jgi:hypothetical protein
MFWTQKQVNCSPPSHCHFHSHFHFSIAIIDSHFVFPCRFWFCIHRILNHSERESGVPSVEKLWLVKSYNGVFDKSGVDLCARSFSPFLCVVLCYYNPTACGISLRQQGPSSAQGKYRNIPLITILFVELYRREAKTLTTMITEEEEKRISVATAISASAAAFRRRRRPSSKHRRRGALMFPKCRCAQICATVVPPPLFLFLFPPRNQPGEAVRNLLHR